MTGFSSAIPFMFVMFVMFVMSMLLLKLSLAFLDVLGDSFARPSRQSFLLEYSFPTLLRDKLKSKHPKLSDQEVSQVLEGLRQFFLVCMLADAVRLRRTLGMPSKIVDDAWHELILMTREYMVFCHRAFGGYLHHTPAGLFEGPQQRGAEQPSPPRADAHQEGDTRSGWFRIEAQVTPRRPPEEKPKQAMKKAILRTLHCIKTRSPTSSSSSDWAMLNGIPLLFALDSALAVEEGYQYDDEALAALDGQRLAWLNDDGNRVIEEDGLLLDAGDGSGGDCGACGAGCGGA